MRGSTVTVKGYVASLLSALAAVSTADDKFLHQFLPHLPRRPPAFLSMRVERAQPSRKPWSLSRIAGRMLTASRPRPRGPQMPRRPADLTEILLPINF